MKWKCKFGIHNWEKWAMIGKEGVGVTVGGRQILIIVQETKCKECGLIKRKIIRASE